MSKLIDSHCHPQFPQYGADRDAMIARALAAGVQMICIGTGLFDSRTAVELAAQFEGMWAAVGMHPHDAGEYDENTIADFEAIVDKEKVVAVGEIGLDYYRITEEEQQKNQQRVFESFLKLAQRHNKPVVIHSRDAAKGSLGKVHADTLSILKNNPVPQCGVAHSFTGTIDEARGYLDLGFYLGFNGIITFARTYDDVVRAVPLDRILLETDAPLLTPEPYRGKPNEPAFVIEVAKKLAELKSISLEEVIEQTTQNCKLLFKI